MNLQLWLIPLATTLACGAAPPITACDVSTLDFAARYEAELIEACTGFDSLDECPREKQDAVEARFRAEELELEKCKN